MTFMRFSLILATIKRTKEVKRFLEYLNLQTYRHFELIVVDQNNDERLKPILKSFKNYFPIIHLYSPPGLARARNLGLKYISGDIVGFPDDDCWYPSDLLEKLNLFFKEHLEVDGLVGCCLDEKNNFSVLAWDKKSGKINYFNIWKRLTSTSLFLKSSLIKKIGNFEETLGAGSGTEWGSGEETDYILRALKKGFQIYYSPQFFVYHPQIFQDYGEESFQKVKIYEKGVGKLLAKHKYPFWFIFSQWIRLIIGILFCLFLGRWKKAKFKLISLRARFIGWFTNLNN